jgi:aspartate carbamoyltransferase catalytic subunit
MVELAEIFNSYGDAVVLRTSDREGFDAIVRDSQIPVINGGNGDLENPSQALVDLYTLFKWRPALMFPDVDESEKLQVGVFGAPGHTRTVHSLLILMSLFPWAFSRIVIFGRVSKLFKPGQREQLEEAGLNIVTTAEMYKQETMFGCLTKELPRMDVMYSHLLKPLDLSKIDREMAVSTLKPNAMVLCPAVHMKEFGGLLDDSSNNGYFCQARNAVYVRMAVIKAILD